MVMGNSAQNKRGSNKQQSKQLHCKTDNSNSFELAKEKLAFTLDSFADVKNKVETSRSPDGSESPGCPPTSLDFESPEAYTPPTSCYAQSEPFFIRIVTFYFGFVIFLNVRSHLLIR
jgi:hypothetical protein